MFDLGLIVPDPKANSIEATSAVQRHSGRASKTQEARSRLIANRSVAAAEASTQPEFSMPKPAPMSVTTPLESALQAMPAPESPLESALQLMRATEPQPASDGMEQVTSVSQLSDLRPTDWAFQALQSLVERYGCIAGYPDNTFRGDCAMTRYEFAAGLNACVDRINELIQSSTTDLVQQQDLSALKKLQEDFAAELATVRGQIDALETRLATLEEQQFSTTTRLFGQAVISAQASNDIDIDLFPRDGVPEREGNTNPTIASKTEIIPATSFRGDDLLLTGLQTGNLGSTAPELATNMGRLAHESGQENRVVLSDLSYRFALSEKLGVIVGPAGVNAANTFRGINPLEGYWAGAISLFGQRNPIVSIGNGTGGIGFDWQISDRVSLQGVYSAEIPSFAGDRSLGGLFGGRYTVGTQLSLAPTDSIDVGLNYLYSHSPDGFLGTGVGDTQLLSPFAPGNREFNTHAIGATAAWRIHPGLTIGAWGGWTSSIARGLDGAVQTTNWMFFSAFPDLFARGNLGGILFGQPPKITASTLPNGYNFPRFSDGGTRGGQPDTAFHLEAFYRARLSDNIDLTPGVLVIFNPNHNKANDTLVIGGVRATFRY